MPLESTQSISDRLLLLQGALYESPPRRRSPKMDHVPPKHKQTKDFFGKRCWYSIHRYGYKQEDENLQTAGLVNVGDLSIVTIYGMSCSQLTNGKEFFCSRDGFSIFSAERDICNVDTYIYIYSYWFIMIYPMVLHCMYRSVSYLNLVCSTTSLCWVLGWLRFRLFLCIETTEEFSRLSEGP